MRIRSDVITGMDELKSLSCFYLQQQACYYFENHSFLPRIYMTLLWLWLLYIIFVFDNCLWMLVAHSPQIKPSLANITLFSCVCLCCSAKKNSGQLYNYFFLFKKKSNDRRSRGRIKRNGKRKEKKMVQEMLSFLEGRFGGQSF